MFTEIDVGKGVIVQEYNLLGVAGYLNRKFSVVDVDVVQLEACDRIGIPVQGNQDLACYKDLLLLREWANRFDMMSLEHVSHHQINRPAFKKDGRSRILRIQRMAEC